MEGYPLTIGPPCLFTQLTSLPLPLHTPQFALLLRPFPEQKVHFQAGAGTPQSGQCGNLSSTQFRLQL
jgi:hypothetical protein